MFCYPRKTRSWDSAILRSGQTGWLARIVLRPSDLNGVIMVTGLSARSIEEVLPVSLSADSS